MKKRRNLIIIIIVIVVLICSSLIFTSIRTITKQKLFENKFFTVNPGLIDRQKKVDEIISEALENSEFTFDNPKIILNPYEIAPLTAVIIFYTPEELEVTIKINNENEIIFPKEKKHIIPIYGLFADHKNQIKIITNDGKEKTVELITDKVPVRFKSMEVLQKSKTLEESYYMVTSPMGDSSAIYDDNGQVRWYLTENFYFKPLFLENGHLILGNGEIRDKYGSSTGFIEINLLGKIYNKYRIDNGYHHYITEFKDNYLLASNNTQYNRFFDTVVEVGKQGQIIKTWDLFEIVSEIDSKYAETLDEVWAWINSIAYDHKTNSLIISLRGRNSIISIDYDTGKINYIFGDQKYWSEKFNNYFLKIEKGSSLPLGQHSIFLDTEGNLGIFNNGFDASSQDKILTCEELATNHSSANIYKINNKTITQIWSYDKNQEFFSYALSNFEALPNNNKLILSGWEIENNQDCKNPSDYPINARIIELDNNDNIIFEGLIKQGKFYATKTTFYTNNTKNINLDTSTVYDLLSSSNSKTINIDLQKLKKAKNMKIDYEVTSNSFELRGLYLFDSEIKLAFISEKSDSIEYLIKNQKSNLLMPIFLDSLSGKYHLFVIENGVYFDTDIVLEFPSGN